MKARKQMATSSEDCVAANAPSTPGAQHVQMSRAELELYIREGRPTGLLLRSIAALKGMGVKDVAQASGLSFSCVESMFADMGIFAVKKVALKAVAAILGIDLGTMKLAGGRVHVVDLSNLPRFSSPEFVRQATRAVGLLTRGARVGELAVGSGLSALRWRGRMHVAQSDGFRAIFIGSLLRRFEIESLPSSTWVCGTRERSSVVVTNPGLMQLLAARDVSESEFDELFQGAKALNWSDILAAARINGVSKVEVMSFIESKVRHLDETDGASARGAASDARPALSLVHDEQRMAAHG